jgi:hypothetical protein
MKFNKDTHIIGKVYDLTQENMCLMLDYIDELEKYIEEYDPDKIFSKELEDMNKCL